MDVRVILPKYRQITVDNAIVGKGIKVHFIPNENYFNREHLYGGHDGDYPDNLLRFAFFCKEVLKYIKVEGFKPDIIHLHDWQTSLIPVYIKTIFANDREYSGIRTVLTVHNLGYQGLFPKDKFPETGLPWDLFNIEGLEFYGKVNLLKGGLLFSDLITTVSPTYAKEIQTKEFGHGLEGVLQRRVDGLGGIINGLDYTEWDPANDKKIAVSYTSDKIELKKINKQALQKEAGLKEKDVPLFGLISRLADQKGLDLIEGIIDDLCKGGAQFILLGTGDRRYHTLFERIKKDYPGVASINLKFDGTLARKIYAGCDFFLMPSRYEPCGLGQLISLRYGTIPIVRETGGLSDTIMDYKSDPVKSNGFSFKEYTKGALKSAINDAKKIYSDPVKWDALRKRAMAQDFSWEESAREYIRLYEKLI
ncbi:MAG: glycogen synthase, partial [Candidatus Omnitrophica bacterium]|nr:glycogen synthase [Candidatus Omnitrophota bacterium]